MKRISILLALFLPFFFGCTQEEDEPEVDAFIFGEWNFFCEGNCIQIYKYDQGKLYIDNLNSFREAAIITYKSTPLDARYNSIAEDLLAAFPSEYLRPRGNNLIACPDCVNSGGYYIAFENKSGVLWWQVGKEPALWPEEIKPFMEQVIASIAQLPEE